MKTEKTNFQAIGRNLKSTAETLIAGVSGGIEKITMRVDGWTYIAYRKKNTKKILVIIQPSKVEEKQKEKTVKPQEENIFTPCYCVRG